MDFLKKDDFRREILEVQRESVKLKLRCTKWNKKIQRKKKEKVRVIY